MSDLPSPLAITDEEQYWLLSRDVSESPKVGGDQYFDEHQVSPPEDVTSENLPPANEEVVREIDKEALEQEKFIGKWQVTGSAERIDELWPELIADAEAGIIWAVKAMTTYGYEHLPMYDDYLLTVYTPNYFERHDVKRVRTHLRDEYNVSHELYYKPDIYTVKGITGDTVEEFGLSVPARYVE